MIANYHTHTHRCNHASGKEREYIERAIKAGYDTLGFSDHSPYLFEDGYYSTFRMRPEQAAEYAETLSCLREEYRSSIKILIGFEMEYYPKYFSRLLQFLNAINYDYLLLGQHFLNNEIDSVYCGSPNSSVRDLSLYVDQTIEAMQTGVFTYLAHPDLFYFTGEDEAYRFHMSRLCRSAKELGIPLEINLLGFYDNRAYPSDRFFSLAAEIGNRVILGCDAHSPNQIGDTGVAAKAMRLAKKYRLQVLDHPKIAVPKSADIR